ncbi:uncharacterized protein [Diadema setosum]|uniref:uncharacterized protein n=1 Tax=Diadema setosum TaxID=31175 RepID=UPI003B3B355E
MYIPPARRPYAVSSYAEVSPEDQTETLTTTTVTETITTRYEDDTLSDVTTQRSEMDIYPEYQRPTSQEIEFIIDGVRPPLDRKTAAVEAQPRRPDFRERTALDIDRQVPLAPIEFVIDTRQEHPQEEYETVTRRKTTTVTEKVIQRKDEEETEPIESYSIEYPEEPRQPVGFSIDLPTPSAVEYSEEEILPRYTEPLRIDVDIPEPYEIVPGEEQVEQPPPLDISFEQQQQVEEVILGPEKVLPQKYEPLELTFSTEPVEEIDIGREQLQPKERPVSFDVKFPKPTIRRMQVADEKVAEREPPTPLELTFEGAPVEEIHLGPEEVLHVEQPLPHEPLAMQFTSAPKEEITLGPEHVKPKPVEDKPSFKIARTPRKDIKPGPEKVIPPPQIPLQPEFEELVIPSQYAPDISPVRKTSVRETSVQEVHPQPSPVVPERGRSEIQIETQPQPPREIELVLDLPKPERTRKTYTETVRTETKTVVEPDKEPKMEYEELVIPGEPRRPSKPPKPTQWPQKKITEPVYTEEPYQMPEEAIPEHTPISPEELPFARAAVTRYPPDVLLAPDDIEVPYGDVARLECQIQGEPQPVARWQRDGVPVTGNRYLTLVERDGRVVLVINPVEEVDDTEFECVATNEEGTVTTYADVFVKDIPPGKLKTPSVRKPKRTERVSVSVTPKKTETSHVTVQRKEERPLKSFEVTVGVPEEVKPERISQRPRGPADVPVEPQEESFTTVTETVTKIKPEPSKRQTTSMDIDTPGRPLGPIELTIDIPKDVPDDAIPRKPEFEVLVVPELPEEHTVTTVTERVTTVVESEKVSETQEKTQVFQDQERPLAPVELTVEIPADQPEFEEVVLPKQVIPEGPEYEVVVVPTEDRKEDIVTITETVSTVVETDQVPVEPTRQPLPPVELTFEVPKAVQPEFEEVVVPTKHKPTKLESKILKDLQPEVEEVVVPEKHIPKRPEYDMPKKDQPEFEEVVLSTEHIPQQVIFPPQDEIPREPEFEVLVVPRLPEEQTTTVTEVVTSVIETEEIPEQRETEQKPVETVKPIYKLPKDDKPEFEEIMPSRQELERPEYEVFVVPQEPEETVSTVTESDKRPAPKKRTEVHLETQKKPLEPIELSFELPREVKPQKDEYVMDIPEQPEYEVLVVPQRPEEETVTTVTETVTTVVETEEIPGVIEEEPDRHMPPLELTFEIPREEQREFEEIIVPQEPEYEVLVVPEEESVTISETVSTVVESDRAPATKKRTEVHLETEKKPLGPVELSFELPREDKPQKDDFVKDIPEQPEYEVLVVPQRPEEETVTTVTETVTTVVETEEFPGVLEQEPDRHMPPLELTFEIPREEQREFEEIIVPQEPEYEVLVVPEEESVTISETVSTVVQSDRAPATKKRTEVHLETEKKPLGPVELSFELPREDKPQKDDFVKDIPEQPEYEVLVVPQRPEEETVTTVTETVTTVVETEEIPGVIEQEPDRHMPPLELAFEIPREEQREFEEIIVPQEPEYEVLVVPEEESVTISETVSTVVESDRVPTTKKQTEVHLETEKKPLGPVELSFELPREDKPQKDDFVKDIPEQPEYEVLVVPHHPEEETVTTVTETVTTVVEMEEIPEVSEQEPDRHMPPLELTFEIPREEQREFEEIVVPQEPEYEVLVLPAEKETVTVVTETVKTQVQSQDEPETHTSDIVIDTKRKPLGPIELTFDVPKEQAEFPYTPDTRKTTVERLPTEVEERGLQEIDVPREPEYEVYVVPQEEHVEETAVTVTEVTEIKRPETMEVQLKEEKPLTPFELTFDAPREEQPEFEEVVFQEQIVDQPEYEVQVFPTQPQDVDVPQKPEYEVLVLPMEKEETVTTVTETVTTLVETEDVPDFHVPSRDFIDQGKQVPLTPVELTLELPRAEQPEFEEAVPEEHVPKEPEYEVLVLPLDHPEEETITTVKKTTTTVVERKDVPDSSPKSSQIEIESKQQPLGPVELSFEVPSSDRPEYEVLVMPLEKPEEETITTVRETITTVMESEEFPSKPQSTEVFMDREGQPFAPIELTFDIPQDVPPQEELAPGKAPEGPEFEVLVMPMQQPAPEAPYTLEPSEDIVDQEQKPMGPVELTFELPTDTSVDVQDVPYQPEYEILVLPADKEEIQTATTVTESVTTLVETEKVTDTRESAEIEFTQGEYPGEVELTFEIQPEKHPEVEIVKPFSEELYEEMPEHVPDTAEPDVKKPQGIEVVVVQEPPEIIKPLEDVVTKVGETLRLHAKVAGHPQPKVEWFKHGKPVKGDRFVTLIERDGNTVLLISPVKKEDETDFECVATNTEGRVSTKAELYIGEKKPKVSVEKPKEKPSEKPKEKPKEKPSDVHRKPAEELKPMEDEETVPIQAVLPEESVEIQIEVPIEKKPEITEFVTEERIIQERPRGPADLPEEPEFEEVIAISEEMVSAEIVLMAGEEPEYEDEVIMPEEIIEDIEKPSDYPEEKTERAEVVIERERQPLQPIELVVDVKGGEQMPQMPEYEEVVLPVEQIPEHRETTGVTVEKGPDDQKTFEIIFDTPEAPQQVSTTVTKTVTEVIETQEQKVSPAVGELVVDFAAPEEEMPGDTRERTTIIVPTEEEEHHPVEIILDVSEDKHTDDIFIEVVRHVTNVEVDIGGRASFTCMIIGKPRPTVQWLANGRPLTGDRFISVFSLDGTCELVITEVQEEDETVYTCHAENSAGVVTTTAELIIPRERPKELAPVEITLEGAPQTIEEVSVQKTTTTITKEVEELPEVIEIEVDDTEAQVTASRITEEIIREVTTEVKEGPVVIQELRSQDTVPGGIVYLECKFTGIPLPTFQWYHNGEKVGDERYVVINYNDGVSQLCITEVTPKDHGTFVCEATNPLGKATTVAEIRVYDESAKPDEKPTEKVEMVLAIEEEAPREIEIIISPPKFDQPIVDMEVTEGEDAKFVATVTGSQPITITWYEGTKPIQDSPEFKISFDGTTCILEVPEALPEDAATYTCKATNPAGEATCTAVLKVKGDVEFAGEHVSKEGKDEKVQHQPDVGLESQSSSSDDSRGDITSSSDEEDTDLPEDRMTLDVLLEKAVPTVCDDKSSDDDHESKEIPDNKENIPPSSVPVKTPLDVFPESVSAVSKDLPTSKEDVESLSASENEDDKDSTTSGEYDTSMPKPVNHEYFHIGQNVQINGDGKRILTPIIEDGEQACAASDNDHAKPFDDSSVADNEVNNNAAPHLAEPKDTKEEVLPCQVQEEITMESVETVEHTNHLMFEEKMQDLLKPEVEPKFEEPFDRSYTSTSGSASTTSDNNTDTQGGEAESEQDEMTNGNRTNVPVASAQDDTILDGLPAATGKLLLEVIVTDKSGESQGDDDDDDEVFVSEKSEPHVQHRTDSPENEYTDLSNPSVSDYAELVVSPKTEEPIREEKSSRESSSSEDDYEELLQDQSIAPSPTKAIKYSEFLQEAKRMLEEDDSPQAARDPETEDKTVLPATAALPSLSPKQDWHEFTVSLEAKHKLGIVQITKKEEVFIYEEVLEWREPRRSADLDEDGATLHQDRNDTEGVMGQDNLESSSERNDDQPLSVSTLPVTLSRGLSTSSQSSDGNKGAGDDTERPLPTSTAHVPTSTETSKLLDIAVAAKRQVASPVKDSNEHHSSDSSEGEQFEKDKVDVTLEFREKCRSRSISSDSESDSERCHAETQELKGEGQLASNLFATEVLLPVQQRQDSDSADEGEQYSPSNIHLQMDPTDLFHAEIVVPEESSLQKQSPKTREEDQKDEAQETQPEDDRSDIVDRVVVIDLGPNLRAPSPITSSEDEHTEDGVTLGVVSVADTVYPSTKFQVPPSSTPDSQTEKDGTTLHSTTLLESHTSPAEEDIRDIPPIEITTASPDPTILHCYLEWTEPRQPLESPVYSDEKEFTESDLDEALFDVSAAPETQSAVLEAESNEQEPVVIEEFLSLKREEYTVMLAPKVMPDITLEIDARDFQADDGPNTVSQNYLAGNTSEKDTDPENDSAEVLAELNNDMAEPTATGEHQPFVTSIEIPVGRIQESVESAAAARPESSSESGSSSPVMLELQMPSNQPDLDEPEKKYVTVKVKVQAPKPRSVQVYFDEPQKQREVFAVHQQKGGKKKSRNSSTQIDMDDSEIPDSLVECSVASDVSFPSFSANGDVRFVSTPDDDNAPLQASFILDITDPHGSSEDEIDDIKCEEMLPSPKPMTESIQCETHSPNLKAPPRAKLSVLLEEYEDDLILKEPEEAENDEHAKSHKMQDDKVNVDEKPVEATRAVIPAGRELQLDYESILFSSGDDVEPQVQSHPVPSDLVSVETDSTEAASEVASYTISAAQPGSQETLIRANIIQVDQANPFETRDAVSSPVEDGRDDLAEEEGKDIIYIPGASHLHVERTPMVDLLQEYDDCLHFTHYTDSDESEKDELGEVIISGAEIIEEEAVLEIRYVGMDEASPGLIQAPQYNGDTKSNANLQRLTPVVTEHTEREVVEVHSTAAMSSNSTILYKREEYREIVTSDWSFSKGITIESQQSDLDSSVEIEERYPSFFTPTKTDSEPFFTDDSKQDETEDPHFSQGLSDMVVEVGDLAIFQCHVGGNPLPDVKWYKDGHPLAPSSNVSMQVMRFQDMFIELVINSARLEDEGRYMVEIINPHGVVTSSAFLTVRASSSSETESGDSSEDAASPGDEHSHSSHESKDQTQSSERPRQSRWPDDASISSNSNSCLELSSAPAAELPNLSDPAASLPQSQSASDTPLSPCSSGQLDDIASVKQDLNQEPSSACGDVPGETPRGASVHALDEFLDSVPMEDQDVHDSVSKGLSTVVFFVFHVQSILFHISSHTCMLLL